MQLGAACRFELWCSLSFAYCYTPTFVQSLKYHRGRQPRKAGEDRVRS